MASAIKQIIGSFEDIGKDIAENTVSLPKDIAEKALESLNSSAPVKNPQSPKSSPAPDGQPHTDDSWDAFDKSKDTNKKAMARAALSALISRPRSSEPSLWEKQNMEKEQKKKQEEEAIKSQKSQELPVMTAKRRAGDLYGLAAKKNAAEIGKNVKSD